MRFRIAGMSSRQKRAYLIVAGMVGSFLILRAFLYFAPNTDLNIGRYNIHHLFTGIIVMTITGILLALFEGDGSSRNAVACGFGIGLGLVLDEWVYLIATDGSNAAYWLPVSVWGGIISISVTGLLIVVLSLRN